MPRGTSRKKGSTYVGSSQLMGWALGGLEREIAETRERLAALTAEAAKLRARVGRNSRGVSAAAEAPAATRRRRRGRMSADARKRLSESTRKRWADRKKKGLNKL